MHSPVSGRTLLYSLAASTLILASATACSRSDRSESGSDNTAAMMQDTAVTNGGQPATGNATTPAPATTDTTTPASENVGTGAAAGDTAPAGLRRGASDAPRAATAPASAENRDTAGYRAMERDTASMPESDSARVTQDTAETSQAPSDTAAVETAATEMARDTATVADQVDTATVASDTGQARAGAVLAAGAAAAAAAAAGNDNPPDNSAGSGVAENNGRVRPPEDSTETMGQVTTTDSVAEARVDTIHVAEASDSGRAGAVLAAGAAGAAVAAAGGNENGRDNNNNAQGDAVSENAGRVRPPEDSTEILGNVTSSETADEEPVSPSTDRTNEVGASAMGGTVTGADAVRMMTRQGVQCGVVDPEANEEVRWDMASTPVTLNPCGLGSMNLSKLWTEVQRGSGATGQ